MLDCRYIRKKGLPAGTVEAAWADKPSKITRPSRAKNFGDTSATLKHNVLHVVDLRSHVEEGPLEI